MDNIKGRGGWSPLTIAADEGRLQVVRLLLTYRQVCEDSLYQMLQGKQDIVKYIMEFVFFSNDSDHCHGGEENDKNQGNAFHWIRAGTLEERAAV